MSNTEIRSVDVRLLSLPLPAPMLTATFPITSIDTALTRVRTEDGHVGVGWCFAFGVGRMSSVVRFIEDLSSVVVGQDALMTSALWTRLAGHARFVGRKGIATLAMAAIDTACWDIAGQEAGLPVYKLLGGDAAAVKAYASQGLWLDRSLEQLVDEATGYVELGFTAVKLRLGLADMREDLARVAAVRTAIGEETTLMTDVNQGWSLKQTLFMADALREFDLYWLEEPMPIENVNDYAVARKKMRMRLCTGESNYFKRELLELLQAGGADCVMPDLMRMGGVTEWMKSARLCEAFGIEVSPHLFMEHSRHLSAACPNVTYQEYMPWWDSIIENPVVVENGMIHLPDVPGFGIEISEEAVARYAVS